MKKSVVICAVLAGVALTGTAAIARDHGPRDPQAMFERFDTDGDGLVTRAEIEATRDARFEDLDADGDGSVTEEEFTASAVERARARAAEAFARLDVDGDGVLSEDTLAARGGSSKRLERMFSRIDANGDDAISPEEVEAAMDRFAEMRQRRGHGAFKN